MAAAAYTYTAYSKTAFMLLFLTIIPDSISSKSNNRCIERSSFACSGPDFHVRFPFRLAQDDPSCGFSPAFTLTCTPNGTHLHLPNAKSYPVDVIDFREQIVIIEDLNCFEQDLFDSSFSLSGSPFAFNESESYTYYNCTPSEDVKRYSVECMNRENYMVIAWKTSYGIPAPNCSAMRTLTVPVGKFGLMDYIALRWYEPDCVACEAQYGEYCSFESHSSSEIVCHVSAGQGLFDNVKQRGMWIVLLSWVLLFSMLILGS